MAPYAIAVIYTLLLWWVSTGAILYLDGLPRRTFRWSMAGATLVLAGALYGLAVTANDTSVAGAYAAFTCALLVWGWQEIAFLLGFVTGPRRAPCPAGLRGWRRAGAALQTIVHHELALLALAGAVAATTWKGANPVGIWTFGVLWAMRQSAKLNLFLGVRNLGEAFLPEHLRYLESYFVRKPMNPLFPVSIVASTLTAAMVWQRALADDAAAGAAAGYALVGTLLAAAILEHAFMVLPLPMDALWRWGLRSRAEPVLPATAARRADA
jgi:putative photosynthetic complex assembly protein 2